MLHKLQCTQFNHSNPEQEKWRNLRINHFLGAYLGKYTFTSKNISQQKRFTHASHLQVYGRYIWPTIRVISRTKTNCNRVWCKAIEGYLQTRLRKHFLEDRYKSLGLFLLIAYSSFYQYHNIIYRSRHGHHSNHFMSLNMVVQMEVKEGLY